ncbi:MAG: zinc ribbon domain-containing protein [Bacteroidota bacterium]|jgi:putative FmdB family regulatory protein
MPTYEYMCKDCKKIFSVIMTFSEHEENPKPACEHCGSKNVEQFFSEVNVITSKKS